MSDDDRTEAARDSGRASELVAIVATIYVHSQGHVGTGQLACPICGRGVIRYDITVPDRARALSAQCSTSGCLRFRSHGRA